jgi:hypothetical protein
MKKVLWFLVLLLLPGGFVIAPLLWLYEHVRKGL